MVSRPSSWARQGLVFALGVGAALLAAELLRKSDVSSVPQRELAAEPEGANELEVPSDQRDQRSDVRKPHRNTDAPTTVHISDFPPPEAVNDLDHLWKALDSQPRDDGWAESKSLEIVADLTDHLDQGFSYAIGTPDCRQTMCRVSLTWSDFVRAREEAYSLLALDVAGCGKGVHVKEPAVTTEPYTTELLVDCRAEDSP